MFWNGGGPPQKGGGGALGNDMRGVAGTEGARPTNLAKDIFSGTSSSLLKFFRGRNFSGGFFLCVAWLCGMVKGKEYMKIRNWAAVAAKFRGSAGPMGDRRDKRSKEPTDWLFECVEQQEKEDEDDNEEECEQGSEDGVWCGGGGGCDSVG